MRRLFVLATFLLLLGTACGGGGDEGGSEPASTLAGDASRGEEVFASTGCGSCHTLEAAGSSGAVGPNLDEAAPSFEAAVQQVRQGGGGMPSYEGKLTEQEIADVAAFVSESAGG